MTSTWVSVLRDILLGAHWRHNTVCSPVDLLLFLRVSTSRTFTFLRQLQAEEEKAIIHCTESRAEIWTEWTLACKRNLNWTDMTIQPAVWEHSFVPRWGPATFNEVSRCFYWRHTDNCWAKNVHFMSMKLKLKLKFIYDRQSVGQSVLVSGAHLGPLTNFSFAMKFPLDSWGFVILCTLSDERTGL
jgi:hypothetical protein